MFQKNRRFKVNYYWTLVLLYNRRRINEEWILWLEVDETLCKDVNVLVPMVGGRVWRRRESILSWRWTKQFKDVTPSIYPRLTTTTTVCYRRRRSDKHRLSRPLPAFPFFGCEYLSSCPNTLHYEVILRFISVITPHSLNIPKIGNWIIIHKWKKSQNGATIK
jgi:hypothetical protein